MDKPVQMKKAKTHKGKVFLESKLPKAVEDPKMSVLINTNNSSELMRLVLNDLVNKLHKKFLILFVNC
jgi:hypothetical protein